MRMYFVILDRPWEKARLMEVQRETDKMVHNGERWFYKNISAFECQIKADARRLERAKYLVHSAFANRTLPDAVYKARKFLESVH